MKLILAYNEIKKPNIHWKQKTEWPISVILSKKINFVRENVKKFLEEILKFLNNTTHCSLKNSFRIINYFKQSSSTAWVLKAILTKKSFVTVYNLNKLKTHQ